ncbi:ABC transporter substrate-binding protein [Neglectibacter timonensis]|uniref:ABC transporter substrate-binding protein n=1 Tax=Neglectibacter timonensis TaxID=1776382 RepID=A0ABT1S161_9FIRM|nr:ABC transporter substrate-binding protein [Neglectibacter timonensis]MCQ4840659.1 ABC transporter substrate-binding protein [Neglectibacter timonensis]MCQ4844060.1 ABC transporter substrate-binding protein [Neglectibacter timonensis]
MKQAKGKRLLAALLALAMFVGLTACGGPSEKTSSPGNDSSEKSAAESGSKAESSEASAGTNADPVTIDMLLVSDGNSKDKEQQVEDAINAILEPALNTTVKFMMVSYADHTEKINLVLASGDKLDLYEPFQSYDNFYANGYMMDISGYGEYYKDIAELLGEGYMECAQIDGVQYGLPSLKDLAQDTCVIFRTDALEAVNADVNDIKNFDDLHDVLVKLKEAYPDITPLMGGSQGSALGNLRGDFDNNQMADILGNGLGVLMDPVNSTEVTDYYQSKSYEQLCNYMYAWKQEGLLDRDSLTSGLDLMRAGKSLCSGYALSPKATAEAGTSAGSDVTAWKVYVDANPLAMTSNAWTWCVNSNCETPERALEMLNFMYTNKEIQNLLAWGIEGEDYQVISDEGVGVIDYMEGQDSGTVNYYQWTKYSFPNNFLQYVMKGTNPHQWEEMDEWNKSADISLAMGFNFDATNVTTQIAACTNVVNEYNNALTGGELDPAVALPEFIQKLKSAGIDEIVKEKQTQLDQWLEAKKK